MRKSVSKQGLFWGICVIFGVLFFFFTGITEPFYTNDSMSYIMESYEREPFYVLIIKGCRYIFGLKLGLNVLMFLQGLAAFSSCLYLLICLRKLFCLNYVESGISYLLLFMPYGFDTMWSTPRVNYTHMIMTDCFSYALFYFFVGQLLGFINDGTKKRIVALTTLTVIMTLNRNQMMVLFLVIIFAVFVDAWKEKSLVTIITKVCNLKKIALACVLVLFGIGLTTGVTKLYCYLQWGYFEKSSENEFTSTTNLLYAADMGDVNDMPNEETKQMFEELYRQVDEMNYNYKYAPSGLFAIGDYMMKCHDPIKSTIIRPTFINYIEEKGMTNGLFESDREKKKVIVQIKKALMKKHFGRWVKDALLTLPRGFTYAVVPIIVERYYPIALFLGVMIWGLFVWMCIDGLRRKKNKKMEAELMFALCMFAFITINVVGVSFIIFSVHRYINYTQGLFWITFYLLLRSALIRRRDVVGGEKNEHSV